MLSVAAIGCDTGSEESVEIGYVNWACATASSYLAANIIETELGIEANLNDLDAAPMWQSVATGDVDFIVCAWLPGTHAEYFGELEDEVVDLGPNYHDARIGLVVPTYVDIDSIEELNDHVDQFEGRIVGIDPGAGIMSATDTALDEYGLDFELVASGDAAMTAELRTAIQNEEWIVVTGWTPHWKFADFDLKFLEDPKGVYGGAETINTITRMDFASDNPAVQSFLDNYYLSAEQLGDLIGMMEEYDDNNEAAQAWMEANRDVVDGWLE
ncbi:MAG: glycine betaine ABC transporter substrate-binding protein [Firmicutes bacterium]|nr:glycine betaine ABC transporter substrate-binding protein [Bacillota bacterium]